MPPRKTRAAKAEASKEEAAPDATVSPAKAATPKRGGRKSARNNAQAEEEEEVGEQVETEQTSTQADEPSAEPSVAVTEPATPKGKAAAKGKGARHQPLAPSASTAEAQDAADQETREEAVSKPDANGKGKGKAREEETEADESGAATSKPTLEDRMEKLRLLRQKMVSSWSAKRRGLL